MDYQNDSQIYALCGHNTCAAKRPNNETVGLNPQQYAAGRPFWYLSFAKILTTGIQYHSKVYDSNHRRRCRILSFWGIEYNLYL